MKTHALRASSLLVVLIMLFGLSLSGTAQQPTDRSQQEKQPIPELTAQESDPEALRIAMPQACRGIIPVVQTHDVADNFTPPGTPLMPVLSPALASFVSSSQIKGYDDPRVNRAFADSFKLRNCRVCYATLEVRVKNYNKDLWTNDYITVGVAPFNSPGIKFIGAGIWNPVGTNPKTLTYALPTAALNSYLSTGSMPSFLDIVAQDDTDFDYIRLSVWYY